MPHGDGRVFIKLRRHRHHYTSGPVRDTKAISLRTELRAKKLLRVAMFQFHIAANEIDPDFADAANDLGLESLFRYLAIVQPVVNVPRPVRAPPLPPRRWRQDVCDADVGEGSLRDLRPVPTPVR